MRDVSYRIVSYDPQEIGLMRITQKAVADFLQIVGLKLLPEAIECKGCEELEKEWEKLGTERDNKFSAKLASIHYKATQQRPSATSRKAILVTSKDIGEIVGSAYGWIAIVSSYKVNNDLDTVATAVYHELGHLHNIPSLERKNVGTYNIKEITDKQIVDMENDHKNKNAIYHCLGEHCLNPGCSMRQRKCFNNWKEHLTEERSPGKPYCDKCLDDLKRKFKNLSDCAE